MTEELEGKRTRKGEVARQRILESALHLFGSRGYEETTMREIAAEAGYSPGLTYRYFESKEEMVLVVYQKLGEELRESTRDIPAGPLAERFRTVVIRHLALMAPYRDVFNSLFGTTLNPRSKAGVFGEDTAEVRRQCRRIYLSVIQGAKDAPREAQREDLATVLYGAHLALVLFWLIDQSVNMARTQRLLTFLRDMLKLIQPILWLPPVRQALARLAAIVGPLLGDERDRNEDDESQVWYEASSYHT
jgi:AcrR family transcriptional regulator